VKVQGVVGLWLVDGVSRACLWCFYILKLSGHRDESTFLERPFLSHTLNYAILYQRIVFWEKMKSQILKLPGGFECVLLVCVS